MEYNPSSGGQGIVQDIIWILGLKNQSVDYTIEDITRNCNRWYDKAVSLILRSDNSWEWDDDNQTDLPIATAALVSGQEDYGISSATFLRITKVLARDSNGNYNELLAVNLHDPEAGDMIEERSSDGNPRMYDKVGNSIILDPAPNYASSDGLKIYFQRVPDYFVAADTTQEPGFAEIYHRYLSLGGAFDYCLAHSMRRKGADLKGEIKDMEESMTTFYAQKAREEKQGLRLRSEDYGATRRARRHHDRLPIL